MKFAAYQRVVTPNTANPPAYRAPTDLQVYGTGGKEFDSLGGALGQANKIALKIQDDNDSSALMDARNKIMTRLTDGLYGEDGLFTTGVGEKASGLTKRTRDYIKETFDDVLSEGKYNGRVRLALQSNLNENFNNYQRIAASQETREREDVDTANYDGALNLAAQNAGLTWNVNGSLTNAQKDVETIIHAHGMKYGWSGLKIESEVRKAKTANTVAAYNAAIAENDYDRANEILRYNRKDMDINTWNQLHGTLKKHEDVKQVHDASQSIFDQCYDPKTGKMDWNKAKQLAHNSAYRSVSGGGAGNEKEAFFNAVEQQESGGDMSAVNSSSGARGVYQIMPENWAEWSSEAGLAGASMDDENAYRQVGRYKMGQYFDKYGPEGALVAWYAGEQNAQRWVDGEPDAIGAGGHYSWDAPQSGGPSVRQYVQETMSRYHPSNSGGSWSPDKTIYYQVKPGKESEVEGMNHNTWMKLQALSAKFQQKFGGEADFEPFYVTAAASQSGHNAGSWHSSGQAFDIAMDSLKRHPERLEWLQEHAKDVGLVPLNEYDGYGNEQYADGENFHFSDHGEAFDESSMQDFGGGSSSSSIYDPEQEDKIMKRVQSLVNDADRQFKQNHADTLENIGMAAKNAGSYTAACDIIDQQVGLTMSESNTLKSQARSYYGVSITGKPLGSRSTSSSRQYVYGNSGARYTQNQINDAESNYEEYQERMADPDDTISRTDQRRYNKAARILNDANGTTGDNLDSDDGLKMARHAVEVTANDEEAEWYLISNYQYSETEAEAYVAMVHGSPEDE